MLDVGKMELLRQKALAKNKGSKSVVRDYGKDDNQWYPSAHYELEDQDDPCSRKLVMDDPGQSPITITDEEREFLFRNALADSYELHRMYTYIVTNPRRNFVLKA